VGTRTGGIPDAIRHGDGGWLIGQDDTAELTGILQRLIEEPAYFREAGLAARARVERECTWDHYMDHFMGALKTHGM
jgi:phosphatidylinositol alpha-1,6-mannosyltransferase